MRQASENEMQGRRVTRHQCVNCAYYRGEFRGEISYCLKKQALVAALVEEECWAAEMPALPEPLSDEYMNRKARKEGTRRKRW